MRKIELTKKGKIVFSIFGVTILVVTIILFILIGKNKVREIQLNAVTMTEADIMDYSKNSLILHVDSKAQLSYTTRPNNKEIEVKFNNYNEDIININSQGVITGLRTGKTEIQIFNENNIGSNIITVYVY